MASNDKILSYTTESILNTIDNIQTLAPVDQLYFKRCTLNSLYGLWSEEEPLHSLKYRYFGMGIGGRYPINDQGICAPYAASNQDMNLYQPIPFRCRPLDEDLSDAERKEYRIRTIQTINGTKYVCYYLKKLTIIDNQVQVFRINPDTQISEPYELDPKHLNPTPTKPSTNDVQSSDDNNVVVGVRMGMYITAKEVYEYIDVKFNGDRLWANISEIGIYKGEDREVNTTALQGRIDYTESIYTILAYKTCTAGSSVLSESWDLNQSLMLGPNKALYFSNQNILTP